MCMLGAIVHVEGAGRGNVRLLDSFISFHFVLPFITNWFVFFCVGSHSNYSFFIFGYIINIIQYINYIIIIMSLSPISIFYFPICFVPCRCLWVCRCERGPSGDVTLSTYLSICSLSNEATIGERGVLCLTISSLACVVAQCAAVIGQLLTWLLLLVQWWGLYPYYRVQYLYKCSMTQYIAPR